MKERAEGKRKEERQKEKKQHQKAMEKLYKALVLLKNTEEAENFLTDLCTPSELEAMRDRWAVVSHIKAKIPYREIHEMTGVSVTTITRVARTISCGTGGYNCIDERLKRSGDDK